MKTIECEIKAFDVNELPCHFVARRCGFYEAAGLGIRLVDTSFIPDDRLPEANFFQVACGAPLLSRNVRFRIALAAVARPMFWLYGAAGTGGIADALRDAANGATYTLTDVSDAWSIIDISGDDARSKLAEGCSVDLDDNEFPVGRYALTRLQRLSVIIHRLDYRSRFRILVDRSVAHFLRDWLRL